MTFCANEGCVFQADDQHLLCGACAYDELADRERAEEAARERFYRELRTV